MRTERLGGLTVHLTGGSDGSGGGDGPMVVLMHGFGAPGTDLVPLAGEIGAGAEVRYAFPEAPLSLPPAYGQGRAWWMIDMMKLQLAMLTGQARDLTREVPEGIDEARALVTAMLADLEQKHRVDRSRLVLGGFSQGAMLALDVILRSDEPLAGLALMSGTLLCEDEWLPRMPERRGLPVLLSHGRQDPILPFDIAERLRDELTGAGLEVRWIPFDGGHGIAPTVIDALRHLIPGA